MTPPRRTAAALEFSMLVVADPWGLAHERSTYEALVPPTQNDERINRRPSCANGLHSAQFSAGDIVVTY